MSASQNVASAPRDFLSGLSALRTGYHRAGKVSVLWGLARFTKQNDFQLHPFCGQNFHSILWLRHSVICIIMLYNT